MSSIPGEVRLGEATVRRRPALPTGAWFYFAVVVAVTTAGATLLLPRIHDGRSGWTAFIVLSTCAAIAQLFGIFGELAAVGRQGQVLRVDEQ